MMRLHNRRFRSPNWLWGVLICALLVGCAELEPESEPAFIIAFDYTNEEMLEFDVEQYLQQHASHLAAHAETISHFSGRTRISPRFLIALMEQQSKAVSNKQFDSEKPYGDLAKATGFLEQTKDVTSRLRSVAKPGERYIDTSAPEQGILAIIPVKDVKRIGLVYKELFPDAKVQPKPTFRAVFNVPMQFPYPVGKKWIMGGTHSNSGSGSIMSSLDFMKQGDDWGDYVSEQVVSSAGGKVKRHSSCYVTVVHANGWSTGYYHVADIVVKTGDVVTANQPLAKYANNKSQALCDGGSSTGPHVHWTLMQQGKEVSLANKSFSGWTVHPGQYNYDENCSRMYLHRDGEKVCPWKPLLNEGISTIQNCDNSCSASCRCDVGQGDCDHDGECLDGLVCYQKNGNSTCIKDQSAEPRLEMSKSTYEVNEKITVKYYNLPGYATDWVGTYKKGTSNTSDINWAYTGGAKNGQVQLAGLLAGDYEARLFFNNSYNLEYTVSFKVKQTAVDSCPNDPNKTEPGECGCGIPEGTCDNTCTDGNLNCAKWAANGECVISASYMLDICCASCESLADECPNDPNKTEPGDCGCGVPEGTCSNTCTDGNLNCARWAANGECAKSASYMLAICCASCESLTDECPNDPNKTEPGECGCGVPEGTCNQKTRIELSKSTYGVNEQIVVKFYGLSGNMLDWVGTYRVGTSNSNYLGWSYTDGAVSGTIKLPGLRRGNYDVRLFFKDSYKLEDSVSFQVK